MEGLRSGNVRSTVYCHNFTGKAMVLADTRARKQSSLLSRTKTTEALLFLWSRVTSCANHTSCGLLASTRDPASLTEKKSGIQLLFRNRYGRHKSTKAKQFAF
jgi:hypothetical protein